MHRLKIWISKFDAGLFIAIVWMYQDPLLKIKSNNLIWPKLGPIFGRIVGENFYRKLLFASKSFAGAAGSISPEEKNATYAL